MNKLVSFIENLSFRLRSENNLSDVTWTMCLTSDDFQYYFLKFFFPWFKKDCMNIYIEREQTNDDSRPDFVFDYNDETYIIENKIWDRNHHFEQYLRTYKINPSNLGYIANYPIVKIGFETHTWTELYIYIKNNIPLEEKELWNAYLNYLKSVCNIYLPTKAMNLEGMNSLYTFYRCLDNVFAFDNDKFHSELYDSRRDTKGGGNIQGSPRDGIMGKYFEIKFKGIRINKTWGWMGVYFYMEQPEIWIGFRNHEGWGQPVYRFLEKNSDKVKSGRTYYPPSEEDNAFWFKFKTPLNFNELNLDQQEKLLKKFFEDVMTAIYNAKISC